MFLLVAGEMPKVVEPLKSLAAIAGEVIKLECMITGTPQPNITWSKDHRELIQSRKYQMTYRDAVASMVVNEVMDKDAGQYKCEATNKFGSAMTSATITVLCEYISAVGTVLYKFDKRGLAGGQHTTFCLCNFLVR